ncbi:putative Ig domain-containing protein [Leptospira sp. FAT2]|uniref:putative Ig domain-containing protein n=1 Tax=Leptospira sanjuanensis TaxID=2879643 RepID=UPI001EE85F3C|nr:putative Ig domain-containing protein [Leptospira sanjuanensis]MCG6168456.1 putative Ig domain-containing protein [Leptospira sanjuanensis]MCG6193873.1 putative Ig domain-containing protein [Leptospira sanjuanensis]
MNFRDMRKKQNFSTDFTRKTRLKITYFLFIVLLTLNPSCKHGGGSNQEMNDLLLLLGAQGQSTPSPITFSLLKSGNPSINSAYGIYEETIDIRAMATGTAKTISTTGQFQFSISPNLPSGLTTSSIYKNGNGFQILGIPTAVTSPKIYTVTATYSGDPSYKVSGTFSMSTVVNAPSLSYPCSFSSPCNFAVNVPISTLAPYYQGSSQIETQINEWTAPSLPAGLSISPVTGNISGTPTTLSSITSYAVTGKNAGGNAQANLNIGIKSLIFGYSTLSTTEYTTFGSISYPVNSPALQSATSTVFSINPALPAGLSLNTSNGTISGTPTATSIPTTYTITGTNSSGSVSTMINIEIKNGNYLCYNGGAAAGCSIYPYTCKASSQCYNSLSFCKSSSPCLY